jgi:hypothetical protein
MKKLKIPSVSGVEVAFGGYPESFFKEALEYQLEPGEISEYEAKAQSLFFEGGVIEANEKSDPEYTKRGRAMLWAVIGSYKPKHEHKIRVCAAILCNLMKE